MKKSNKKATVLVIDDEEPVRDYIKSFLDPAEYRVVEAENGKIALERLSSTPVDLIITDLVMPEKEGIETIKEIKSLYPGCAVIAMSGATFNDIFLSMAECLGAGVTIQKPFKKEVMLKAIDDLLQRS